MDKILETKESKLYRFQCDCLSAEDAMDIDIEKVGKCEKYIIVNMNFYGNGKWDRIKYAFQILRGFWNWREFVVRSEDAKCLSDIFNPDKGYEELP